MTLKEIALLILQKNYLFEIVIDGKDAFKRKSVNEVLQNHESIDSYLKEIARLNNVTQMGVQLFQRNGTSFKRIAFFLVSTVAVDGQATNHVGESTNHVDESIKSTIAEQLNGAVSIAEKNIHTPQSSNKMDAKAEILQVRLDFATEKVKDLERRNKELERKNDELYTESTKLLRENLTQRDKLDLEFKQKEMDLNSEKKSGLSGLMEEVKTLPTEAWQLIAGMFPNHPMNKALNGGVTQAEQTEVKHSDPEARVAIDCLNESLMNQAPEKVAMIAMLTQVFVNKPAVLKNVYLKFYPEPGQVSETQPTQENIV